MNEFNNSDKEANLTASAPGWESDRPGDRILALPLILSTV